MAINKRKQSLAVREGHRNHEGGISFDVKDPFTRLQIAATSCFFGEPAFYVDGDSAPATAKNRYRAFYPTGYDQSGSHFGEPLLKTDGRNTRQLMEDAIDAALAVDVRRTLEFAATLRNDWYMRATPQAIMVRAAIHPDVVGTSLISEFAPRIMSRLDEVMTQMAYFEDLTGNLKAIPSRLKRAWAARLSAASEYELAKYKMTSRNVNVYDAVRLTHPSSEAIDRLIQGKVSLQNAETQTWEAVRSSGGSWNDAARKMGHMALLRNLRNLNENGEINQEILERLIAGVEKGKQFPFRYWSALKSVGDGNAALVDAIEECFEQSIKFNVPRFAGKGLCITDVSGSMNSSLSSRSTMTYAEIARLMAVVTAKAHANGGDVRLFATDTKKHAIRRKASSFDEVRRMERTPNLGYGTDICKAFRALIRAGTSYDVIWVYSDMQCGYDKNVASLLNQYRSKVNPNAQVFFVNLAGYQDALVPEYYDKTYLIGGWSDKVLQFADKIIGLTAQ